MQATPTFPHLWDDVRGANDHAADGNQLINILRVQVTHVLSLLNIESTNLKDIEF